MKNEIIFMLFITVNNFMAASIATMLFTVIFLLLVVIFVKHLK